MPIYEFYCPNNHKIYQFYARSLAQGRTVPKCPDNPAYPMEKMFSRFAVTGPGRKKEPTGEGAAGGSGEGDGGGQPEDPRMDAAMADMEREFSSVDENDPKAMGRMMRRMAEMTGEKIDGEMEEVVRKLEEGADPDSLEEQMGGSEAAEGADPYGGGPPAPGGDNPAAAAAKEAKHRFRVRRGAPFRDPKLYDY